MRMSMKQEAGNESNSLYSDIGDGRYLYMGRNGLTRLTNLLQASKQPNNLGNMDVVENCWIIFCCRVKGC